MHIQKDYLKQKFQNSKETYTKCAILQQTMQDILWNLLQEHKESLGEVLELGIGNGILSQKIIKHYKPTRYIGIDLVNFALENIEFIQADFEMIEHIKALKEKKFDLILSNAALQWSNQRVLLPKLSAFLKENGILLFSTFGSDNFKELKTLFGLSLDYLELQEYPHLLSDFKILNSFEHTQTLHFNNPLSVFKHLKVTGVNALKPNFTLTKAHLNAYTEQFQNHLTYHMLFLLAQKS
ncbi:methyltransferase domain-containing protein [Helicobacter sp. MIT 11-5569]|uniref:methyltransferase domain-containing protein n=1 Tax=Helicobacter sp. MIT 11-5569 TaxID=1548151 RepID=UPI00068A8B17|nr:methyltransferase domain-containing protein [Helicobacter sp. MIT 11-5569]TLD82940.1 methyltransferase domain-containing protein [Helicobacter sp. MIT 11-5569]